MYYSLCSSTVIYAGFFAEAIEWHKEEVNYSEIANDTLGLAIGNRKIGECFCELSKFDEAIEHQKQHLKVLFNSFQIFESGFYLAEFLFL